MNRHRTAGFLVTSAMRRLEVLSSRNLKLTLIILENLSAPSLVYEALTAIGKDCDRIGKKPSARYLARPKAGIHSNSL